MSHSAYDTYKGRAYPALATIASCDHQKAKANGYRDGWAMLLDKHDDNEMGLFCLHLTHVMTREQATVLLDGLVKEYTEFPNWIDFTDACCTHPAWRPSRETLAQFLTRKAA